MTWQQINAYAWTWASYTIARYSVAGIWQFVVWQGGMERYGPPAVRISKHDSLAAAKAAVLQRQP